MLCTLRGAGLISTKTGVEKNTVSTPDEEIRMGNEAVAPEKEERRIQTKETVNE